MADWQVRDRFLDLQTRWMTLIGEHLETDRGEFLEYWRIERSHSVIVLPLRAGSLILPKPMYRPGVGQTTLDFPGGRWPAKVDIETAAQQILQRELGLPSTALISLNRLNEIGWPVNSSFSNQRVYGLVAQLDPEQRPSVPFLDFATNPEGIADLAEQLQCLQCRMVLREWQLQLAATST